MSEGMLCSHPVLSTRKRSAIELDVDPILKDPTSSKRDKQNSTDK